MWMYRNANELYHFGIPGMKWGIRRYQNKDGSLTPAGEKRKAKLEAKLEIVKGKQTPLSEAEKQVADAKRKEKTLKSRSAEELYKNADVFDQKELQSAYDRLQLESKVASMIPSKVNKGEKFVESIVKYTKKASEFADSGTKMFESYKKIMKLINGDEDDPMTAAKKSIIRNMDVEGIKKNISKFTDDELRAASSRFGFYRNITESKKNKDKDD